MKSLPFPLFISNPIAYTVVFGISFTFCAWSSALSLFLSLFPTPISSAVGIPSDTNMTYLSIWSRLLTGLSLLLVSVSNSSALNNHHSALVHPIGHMWSGSIISSSVIFLKSSVTLGYINSAFALNFAHPINDHFLSVVPANSAFGSISINVFVVSITSSALQFPGVPQYQLCGFWLQAAHHIEPDLSSTNMTTNGSMSATHSPTVIVHDLSRSLVPSGIHSNWYLP